MPRIEEAASRWTLVDALQHRSQVMSFFATIRPQSEWVAMAQYQVSHLRQLATDYPSTRWKLAHEAALEWQRLVAANLSTAKSSDALFQTVKANRLSGHAWVALAEMVAAWMYSNGMARGTELSRRIEIAELKVLDVQGDA